MKDHLEYKGYRSTIDFSAADTVFYGKLDAIDDLVSFEADSITDLEVGFREAVDDYLKTCQKLDKTHEKNE